jgi:hypothetical protein
MKVDDNFGVEAPIKQDNFMNVVEGAPIGF